LQKHIDVQSEVSQLAAVKKFVYGYKLDFIMIAEG